MPVATITIAPLPEQVRTVRMVAGTAARRGRVPEDEVDDVRLAVGEAVARVVLRHQRSVPEADVTVHLRDDPDLFEVEILDRSPADLADDDDGMSVALTEALAPRCSVTDGADGARHIRLTWPLPEAPLG